MAIRKIYTFPDEVLRQQAHPVTEFNQALQLLVADMIETMREAPGVGLAAPQVGVSQQVVVVEFGNEDDDTFPKQLYILVNPEIIEESQEKEKGIEGCLSVPGLVGVVERATVVTVRAQTPNGKKTRLHAEGWLARIFQHEIDHLKGTLYIDRSDQIWQPEDDENDSI